MLVSPALPLNQTNPSSRVSRLAVPRQAGQPDQELPESPGQSALHLQRGVQEGGERPGGERLHQGPLRQDTGREALGVLRAAPTPFTSSTSDSWWR